MEKVKLVSEDLFKNWSYPNSMLLLVFDVKTLNSFPNKQIYENARKCFSMYEVIEDNNEMSIILDYVKYNLSLPEISNKYSISEESVRDTICETANNIQADLKTALMRGPENSTYFLNKCFPKIHLPMWVKKFLIQSCIVSEKQLDDRELIRNILLDTNEEKGEEVYNILFTALDNYHNSSNKSDVKEKLSDYLKQYQNKLIDRNSTDSFVEGINNITGKNNTISNIRSIIASTKFKITTRFGYRIVTLKSMKDDEFNKLVNDSISDRHKALSDSKEKEEIDMASYKNNGKNTISAEIANKREFYPYGILYGSFSPNVQDKFNSDYVTNTSNLLDVLSLLDNDVKRVVELQKDKKSYNDLGITQVDAEVLLSNTCKSVRKYQEAIINGVEYSTLTKDIFKDINLSNLTRKYLVKSRIVSLNQIDEMNSKEEFISSIYNVCNGNSHVVADDLFSALKESGYDTSRFGYCDQEEEKEEVKKHRGGKDLSYDKDKIPEAINWVIEFSNEPIPGSLYTSIIEEMKSILQNPRFKKAPSEAVINKVIKENSDYYIYNHMNHYFFIRKSDSKSAKTIAETALLSLNEEKILSKMKKEREMKAIERMGYHSEVTVDEVIKAKSKKIDILPDVTSDIKMEEEVMNNVEAKASLISEEELLKRLIDGEALPLVNVHMVVAGNCPKCGTKISFTMKQEKSLYCGKCLQKIKITY